MSTMPPDEYAPEGTPLEGLLLWCWREQAAETRKVKRLRKACAALIRALRIQAQLARRCGGDIAVSEENAKARDIAKAALAYDGREA